MGTKSKGKVRQVNFSGGMKMLSEAVDRKLIENTHHFTQALTTMKLRLEALEDLLMDKLGETEASLADRVILRVEKQHGFEEVSTPVQLGSTLRLKVKQEIVGEESSNTQWQDAFISVGLNQIDAAIDTLVIGAVVGQTLDVVVPNPQNATSQIRLTVTVMKIFKGTEANNETQTEALTAQSQ